MEEYPEEAERSPTPPKSRVSDTFERSAARQPVPAPAVKQTTPAKPGKVTVIAPKVRKPAY